MTTKRAEDKAVLVSTITLCQCFANLYDKAADALFLFTLPVKPESEPLSRRAPNRYSPLTTALSRNGYFGTHAL